MLFILGTMAAILLCGALLSALRVQEGTWRRVAHERRRHWEDSLR